MYVHDMIYLTAVGLTPGGSSTVHIYTQTIHRTTQFTIRKSADRVPSLRGIPWHLPYNWGKKHEKTSARVAGECQLARWKQNIQNRAYITIRKHKHNNKNTQFTKLNKSKQNIQTYLSLRGLSPRANYTDRAAAAGRRS